VNATDVVALDSGVLIALAKGDRDAEAAIKLINATGARLIIPVPVLAETLRGSNSDAAVNRMIRAVDDVVLTTEVAARSAGARLAAVKASPPPTVDALIVATAEDHRATKIMTCDPDDIGRLVYSATVIAL
jgi:predicted nucleic acid-binding protein